MSTLKRNTGYSISAATLGAGLVLSLDRYAEFAAGAESLASFAIPPMLLMALAGTTLLVTKLGHPSEEGNHA